MKEEYVKHRTAKLLKEKGFNGHCHVVHINNHNSIIGKVISNSELTTTHEYKFCKDQENCITIPTQQMACRWLRETHNIDIWVRPHTGIMGVKVYTPYITTYKLRTKGHMYYHEGEPDRYDSKDHFIPVPDDKGLIPAHQHYSKYEDAVEAALQYVLNNLI